MKNFTGSPEWGKEAAKLIGRKIVDVRWMSQREVSEHGWSHKAPVLVLDDGNVLYPSSDDEGNDAGSLFGSEIQLPRNS